MHTAYRLTRYPILIPHQPTCYAPHWDGILQHTKFQLPTIVHSKISDYIDPPAIFKPTHYAPPLRVSCTNSPNFNFLGSSIQKSMIRITRWTLSGWPAMCLIETGYWTSPSNINFRGGTIQKLLTKISFQYLLVHPEAWSNSWYYSHPPPKYDFLGYLHLNVINQGTEHRITVVSLMCMSIHIHSWM